METLEQWLLDARHCIQNLNVVVVGDVMLDRYLIGDAERVSPEAPVPVVDVTRRQAIPGGAANVAMNVAALGVRVTSVGCVGPDIPGAELRHILQQGAVTDGLVKVSPDYHTIVKTRIVARGQQVVRVDEERNSPLSEAAQTDVLLRVGHALGQAHGRTNVLLVEDYNKGVLTAETIGPLLALAQDFGARVVVDPKVDNFDLYRNVWVVKPNEREFSAVVNGRTPAEVLQQQGVQALVVTRGERGMDVYEGTQCHTIPSIAQEVADVSGAGDTVTAWLGVLLGVQAPLLIAAQLANIAAGIEVTKRGVATVTFDEVLTKLRS